MKKSKIRIYIDKELSSNLLIYLKKNQHHYLKNVMRTKINDTIKVFDGRTGEWLTKIISINRDSTVLKVMEKIKKFDNILDIWLIFSPIKSHRMNIAIQKATELGISRAIPCLTEFSNVNSINII